MLTIIREQFAKLPASAISGLRGGLASVALQLRGVVTVATGCSGSEALFHTLALLLAFWRTALGIELSVHHAFFCNRGCPLEASLDPQAFQA